MAEPWREQVFAAFAARLATIVTGPVVYGSAAVVYQTTPSLVTRALLWINQYDQPLAPPAENTQLDAGPVLGVVRGSGSTFGRLEHVPDPGISGFAHDLRLTVWGYVKGLPPPGAIAGTLLERLFWDHVQAILVEPRFSGLVTDAVPDGPLDTDDGVLEPLGYFAQDWLVTG